MLERDMEELIANYPDEFFPNYGFTLKGRQQSFYGVGRFDLLFEDRHRMTVLMELKAVPARYDVIDQVAKYRDALVAQGHADVLMWIVAPSIPFGLRSFLSHLGIEYTEIHESEFLRVGSKVGHHADEPVEVVLHTVSEVVQRSAPQTLNTEMTGVDVWGYGHGTQPSYLLKALEAGGQTKAEIRSGFVSHFYPDLTFAEGARKSGFGVFFSDSKRPVGTYHGSRSLIYIQEANGALSLDAARCEQVKRAIRGGILSKMRGLHWQRDRERFHAVLEQFGLPHE